MIRELAAAMPSNGAPDGSPHARWVGWLEVTADDRARGQVEVRPVGADHYRKARVLLRDDLDLLDFVEAEIVDGTVTLPIPTEPTTREKSDPAVALPISVVVCTRDRPQDLAHALASITALDYPEFEVVVVDNAPPDDKTARVIAELADPRVRRVVEPKPGLSNARNTGVGAARHEIVAFTDDDVVVDPHWLRALARGFARNPDAACICGLVPSGELRTAAQAYFDQRVSWASTLVPTRFSMDDQPAGVPLFPFQVGRYGTGANFAIKRAEAIEMGGFDEALGAGSPTRGGEDIDMFYRLVMAGRVLVNDPAAIVWHRHRAEASTLLEQATGYGVGFGAWATKVMLDRDGRRLAFTVARRRLRDTADRGLAYGAIAAPKSEFNGMVPRRVGATEIFSVLGGPWALWRGRRQGRRPVPLAATAGAAHSSLNRA
ncbi:hypothetical protein MCHIJ_41800 [Mycolicibacterium chitae]|uniref:Glycosyl transferase family protein n=1 Tax=Mycolicibacterium chitae TaxID=1792 RepID=A0A3S5EIF7_MYCCI|nr:glycosyltransferase family 2 protein [Mycolicibacterium chitae]BBZ04743.1 hypothetical protein MCHIJ_41800 [Mycolicibacterium chitae]VEG48370.1 glycosyl transferase family protein [Mycolicibacterium chitae]